MGRASGVFVCESEFHTIIGGVGDYCYRADVAGGGGVNSGYVDDGEEERWR